MQNNFPDLSRINFHHLSNDSVLEKLNTTSAGLSQDEAQVRLINYGKNNLPQIYRRSIVLRFLLQFHNILIYLLIGSALITVLLGKWIDACVILAVVIINAIISFFQEEKAERAMDSIRHMLATRAHVLRNGERISIDGEYLVPGDVVIIESGEKVPADIRLLSSYGLTIQESILTGESMPVMKNTESVAENALLGDRSCMAYSGTLVAAGQGKGVVIATGCFTEIGRINNLLTEVEDISTPIMQQMGVFAKWLTICILIIAALLLAYGLFIGNADPVEIFMAVVGLSVAAIPEGLPAVLTITLATGAQAMAKRNAIVRRLTAIETLGSVSVICTDKTGTLTRNAMMVVSVVTQHHIFTLDGAGYSPNGVLRLDNTEVSPSKYSVLEQLALAAVLCNDGALRRQGGEWVVEGDPMEGALLTFAEKMNLDTQNVKKLWVRTDAIPFDAKYRFMATLNHDHEKHAVIVVKGAPERILIMCRNQLSVCGKVEPLDINYWNEKTEFIAGLGQRVLAFAVRWVKTFHTILEYQDIDGALVFIGMVGLVDPPRIEAISALKECRKASIRVKMITGDHAQTSAAIGKQIGLTNVSSILTGADLDAMSDGELSEAVLNCDIFARTSPEHKLRLVTALQSHGMIVAMTGDGVNDAPALKRADAGIAMGMKGSEAAKEASDLVLVDDNFASIVDAVREGRTVYDNIMKVISWTLPTSAGVAMTIVIALLFGMNLPVTPVQILWINLITTVTLGIALAFEPTEANTMRRPPRPRDAPILNSKLVSHIILVSILFICGVYGIHIYADKRGYSIDLARTIAVNTLVIMEIFHLFFIRNIFGSTLTWDVVIGTKVVWISVIITFAAQFAITYLPYLQMIFATRSISVLDWLLICAIGIALFILLEIEKRVRLYFKSRF